MSTEWKKVFESDLEYIVGEFKEGIDVPALVILEGPVGAGKTTFMKKFVDIIAQKSTEDDDQVVSPTYSLIQEVGRMAHADFYRITDEEEIIHLEIPLYLEDKDYFIVEWGKKYLSSLKKEVDDRFNIYCLTISVNENSGNHEEDPSRNFILETIK